jgi:hypothetical protein
LAAGTRPHAPNPTLPGGGCNGEGGGSGSLPVCPSLRCPRLRAVISRLKPATSGASSIHPKSGRVRPGLKPTDSLGYSLVRPASRTIRGSHRVIQASKIAVPMVSGRGRAAQCARRAPLARTDRASLLPDPRRTFLAVGAVGFWRLSSSAAINCCARSSARQIAEPSHWKV